MGVPNPPDLSSYTQSRVAEQIRRPWTFLDGLVAVRLQLTTSPGAGYYLKSDAYGNGTWSSALSGVTITVADNAFTLQDNGDATKQGQFQLSGITAGNTRTLTWPDSDGIIACTDITQTWTGQNSFTGSTDVRSFTIKDNIVPTKGLTFSLFGATANKTLTIASNHTDNRTITIPDAAGTIPLLSLAQTWTALQTFRDTTFKVVDDGDATKTFVLSLGGASTGADLILAWAGTADRTITLPDATTTLAGLSIGQTFTEPQVFSSSTAPQITQADATSTPFLTFYSTADAQTVELKFDAAFASNIITLPSAGGTLISNSGNTAVGFGLRSFTAASGASFFDTTTTTKRLRMVLSGAVGNNSFTFTNTAARNYGFGNLSGNVIISGDDTPPVASGNIGRVSATAQTANIATTDLTNTPPAAVYGVEVYLMCTTADVTAGTLTVTIGWTDDVGATTSTPITGFSLAVTGRTTGRQLVRVNSGNITYAVTVTGAYGTSQYAVYVRILAEG